MNLNKDLSSHDRAWARLVNAVITLGLRPYADAEREIAMAEVDAAKRALRDLGVGVDALLEGR